MRFVSWNVNGIRAAIRKGIDDYFSSIDADIWMLQEVRALPSNYRRTGAGRKDSRFTFTQLKKRVILGSQRSPASLCK